MLALIRPAWRYFWKQIGLLIGAIALAIYLPTMWFSVLLVLLYLFWCRYVSALYIYEDRIALRTGIFSKDIKEVLYVNIRTVDIYQSLIDRILNVGEVRIATAGTSGYEIVFKGIYNPESIRRFINEKIESHLKEV